MNFIEWLMLAPDGDASSPQQIGANITQYITLAVAVIAAVGAFVSKKAKTPADELARADFAYRKIEERLTEVDKDRTYLNEVVAALREQLRKADDDANESMEEKRKLRALVDLGEERIRQLMEENAALQKRIDNITAKVKAGEPITLQDVYGNVSAITPPLADDLGDLEFTVIPDKKEA